MLLMLGVLPAQVSSFGAVGGALGSGCAAGEVRPKIGLAAARVYSGSRMARLMVGEGSE